MSKITPAISTDSSSSKVDSPSAIITVVKSKTSGPSVNWRVRSDWGEVISGQEAPDWFNLKESDNFRRIKQGQGREVWRVKLGKEAVFAKIAGPTAWLDHIKIIIASSSIDREWRALIAASNCGIPVVEALAIGCEAGRDKRSVLITHEFDGATDLKQYWMDMQCRKLTQSTAHEVRKLVVNLADFIADSHKKGFVHRDLHPANILLRKATGREDEFRFVDLLGGQMSHGEVRMSAAVHSLSQLSQFFARTSSKTTRLRFLRAYLSYLNESAEGDSYRRLLRKWAESISYQSAIIAASLSRQRNRRLYRNGKYFAQWKFQTGWRGTTTLTLARRHIFPEPDIADRSKQAWDKILDDILSNIAGDKGADGILEADGLMWKHQWPTSLLERLRWTLFGSPAKREFIENHVKRHRGEKVPIILGYFQHVQAGLVDCCLTVCPADERKDH